jgi:hypothetical protein
MTNQANFQPLCWSKKGMAFKTVDQLPKRNGNKKRDTIIKSTFDASLIISIADRISFISVPLKPNGCDQLIIIACQHLEYVKVFYQLRCILTILTLFSRVKSQDVGKKSGLFYNLMKENGMRKLFHIVFLPILLSLTLYGCEKASEQSISSSTPKSSKYSKSKPISPPDEVLKHYLDAKFHNLHEEAYKYISEKDKKVKSKEEYLAEGEDNPFVEALGSRITYEIEKIEQHENMVKAIVAVTMPDFGTIFIELMGAAFTSAMGGKKDEAQIEKIIAEKYSDNEMPLVTAKEDFTLLKESNGWKVFLDWEAKKLKAEKDEKIKLLLTEADELKKSKKLRGAVEKYEQILELDSEMVDAKEGLEETTKEINLFEEKQAYLKNVELKNLKVSEGKKYGFGDLVPGVFGTIVNNGNRTLRKVELTVYFLNAEGVIVGEEDFFPIFVSDYSFGDDSKLLKPNYVKDFGFSVEKDAPSTWAKKVKWQITDIEFME